MKKVKHIYEGTNPDADAINEAFADFTDGTSERLTEKEMEELFGIWLNEKDEDKGMVHKQDVSVYIFKNPIEWE